MLHNFLNNFMYTIEAMADVLKFVLTYLSEIFKPLAFSSSNIYMKHKYHLNFGAKKPHETSIFKYIVDLKIYQIG
jgi:hypothetical protein